MMLQTAVLSVLFFSVHSLTLRAPPLENSEEFSGNLEDDVSTLIEKANVNVGKNLDEPPVMFGDTSGDSALEDNEEYSGTNTEDDAFSVSTLLEKANVNVGKNSDEPQVMFGDIAVPTGLGNADPCTARGCMWPKACDGKVYIPYRISRQYSQRERATIILGLRSFSPSTCIRFIPANRTTVDFLDIKSLSGCYSYLGRQGGRQTLSLKRRGCVYKKIVQHEVLHALGFHHEQSRSDRDRHIRILWQNIIPEMRDQFRRVQTNNLGTPYDYNSVMHYRKTAFSRNGQPTMVPIPNRNVAIGLARQMSANDILRVNRLYRCST